jgi:hypothetical protein
VHFNNQHAEMQQRNHHPYKRDLLATMGGGGAVKDAYWLTFHLAF